jgi:hypothetical protein
MSTKTLTLNFSQNFSGNISSDSKASVPLPVNTFWTDSKRDKLSVNVFLILNQSFDITKINPTCDWDAAINTLTIDFPLNDIESGRGTNPNAIWYLEYLVDFGAAFHGDMTIITSMSELTVSAPETKRGTTTTVQH